MISIISLTIALISLSTVSAYRNAKSLISLQTNRLNIASSPSLERIKATSVYQQVKPKQIESFELFASISDGSKESKPSPIMIIPRIIKNLYNLSIGAILSAIVRLFSAIISKFAPKSSDSKIVASDESSVSVPVKKTIEKSTLQSTASAARQLTQEQLDDAKALVAKKLKEMEELEKTTVKKTDKAVSVPSPVSKASAPSIKVESVAATIPVEEYKDPATHVKLMIYAKDTSRPSNSKESTVSTISTTSSMKEGATVLAMESTKKLSMAVSELIDSFPVILSDSITDPLYMKYETGPVDTYATFDGYFSQQQAEKQSAETVELLPVIDPKELTNSQKENEPVTLTVELPPLSKYLSKESLSELKSKMKSAGLSGTIAYILTELAFWAANAPLLYAASQPGQNHEVTYNSLQ